MKYRPGLRLGDLTDLGSRKRIKAINRWISDAEEVEQVDVEYAIAVLELESGIDHSMMAMTISLAAFVAAIGALLVGDGIAVGIVMALALFAVFGVLVILLLGAKRNETLIALYGLRRQRRRSAWWHVWDR
ncbi:hypothetical protein LTA6_000386 [Microbacterium sp. LTA6]|uniref:hypothetical protein n=1 Tax=unclassified Microbacterium TaxID=2609290 RepID=UPI0031399B47